MELAARIDEYGKPAWIALMVLGFIIFWPIGLAILAYTMWSGRMGCWKFGGAGRWHGTKEGRGRRGRRGESSGNVAFDEYREETLRRLEEEQEQFEGFLARLRQAKDKAEFDQFMDERRRRTAAPRADETGGDDREAGQGFRGSPEGPAPYPAG